jgi:hypothetical protein
MMQKRMDQYDKAVGNNPALLLSDEQKIQFLKNAVSGVTDLANVSNDDVKRQVTQGAAPFTYDEYTRLLMHCANTMDIRDEQTSATHQNTFRIMQHDIQVDDEPAQDTSQQDDDDSFPAHPTLDFAANVHIMANAHRYRTSMGREKWDALSDNAKLNWDKLEEPDKAIILGELNLGNKNPPSSADKNKEEPC